MKIWIVSREDLRDSKMEAFEFYAPTKMVFGKDTENRTGELIREAGGSRVFILYGGGSVIRSGLLKKVENAINEAGLTCMTMGGVRPNPLLSFAEEARQKAESFHADFIMAVGGGSVIDTAKAVAHGTANPGIPLWDIWSGKFPLKVSLPVGDVITIPAAGSEMSGSAVLTNEATGEKKGLSSPLNRCHFSILNPLYLSTLPDYQLAAGITDIMMHTLERYFIPDSNAMLTDEIAEGLLRTVVACGRKALSDKNDFNAMGEILWAASLSHNDLTHVGRARDFCVHKFGHALSARYDITHGASLSAVWGSWALYVYEHCLNRFVRYAQKVWGITSGTDREIARAGIMATVSYFREIGMPVSLKELGLAFSHEDLHSLALNTTQNDTVTLCRIIPLHARECEDILQAACHFDLF